MHSVGNTELMKLSKVAFLCSRSYPPGVAEKACRWAELQREEGICVISGYHSPIEKEVLHRLLLGTQPVVIALAKGLKKLDPVLGDHIEAGRLLVITRYAESVSHADEAKCYQRNLMMVGLAERIVVAHASPGGTLERLCATLSGREIARL